MHREYSANDGKQRKQVQSTWKGGALYLLKVCGESREIARH